MTAWAFETRHSQPLRNEINKTKLYSNTSTPSWHKHAVVGRAVSSDRYIILSLSRYVKVLFVTRLKVDRLLQGQYGTVQRNSS